MLILLYIVFAIKSFSVDSWNLENFNVGPNYYISSVAVFGNRAFLALPRSSCFNNITNPTLIEVSWLNEQNFHIQTWKKSFALDEQTWDNCDHIQDAVYISIEKSKLWILDKGNDNCPAKIIIYNLFHNSLSTSCELKGLADKEKLSSLVLDPTGPYNPRAYIGFENVGKIVIFTLNELKWWAVDLEISTTQFLTLAPKEPLLFISGRKAEELYQISLQEIRESEGPLAIVAHDVFTKINATFLGDKLGQSSGLVADLKSGLIYYLVRDYAVVRWNYRNPPKAEYYNVLAQSYDMLPYVSQLFTGPQNGIWALVNPVDSLQCVEDNEIPEDALVLKTRVVKILKYNLFNQHEFTSLNLK